MLCRRLMRAGDIHDTHVKITSKELTVKGEDTQLNPKIEMPLTQCRAGPGPVTYQQTRWWFVDQ